jgi:HK97 family phage prohead protease
MSNEEFSVGGLTRQAINFETRNIDDENRIIEYVGSNQSIDRYSTRLMGWKLKDYKRNPVFLWAHRYDMPPVGRTVDVKEDKETGELRFRVQYAPREIYPFAGTIYDMVKEGYLSAVSVGFSPGKVEFKEDENIHELRDNDLMELSQVPVPANPQALVNAFQRGMVPEEHKDLLTANVESGVDTLDGASVEDLCEQVRAWIVEQDQPDPDFDPTIELVNPTIELSTEADAAPEDEVAPEPLQDEKLEEVTRDIVAEEPDMDATEEPIEDCTPDLEAPEPVHTPTADPDVGECMALGALSLIADCVDVTFSAARGNYSELVQAVQGRVGAVLNRKNQSALEQAGELIRSVLDSAANGEIEEEQKQADEPTVEDFIDGRMEHLERAIGRLSDKIDTAAHNTVAQTLISRRSGADIALDGVLTKLEKLGRRNG